MKHTFSIETDKITHQKAMSLVERQAEIFAEMGLTGPDAYEAAQAFFERERDTADPEFTAAYPL